MPKYTTRLDGSQDDPMADALDITPRPKAKEVTVYKEKEETDYLEKTDGDKFKEAHDSLKEIIETGKLAAEQLADFAQHSQQARDYEVLSGLLKTMIDANKQLVDNEKIRVDIDAKKGKLESAPQINQNNLIVGSTEEALELLAKQKELTSE